MTTEKSTGERTETGVQVALMLGVGAVAACASWSHVLDLARLHGQGGWLAWAVAACTETAAVSAGLEVRRRRRHRDPVELPVTVLLLATVLQLAAQVATAERSAWGVVLAAVPAVTFLVLVKLALGRGATPAAVPAAVPVEQRRPRVERPARPVQAPSGPPAAPTVEAGPSAGPVVGERAVPEATVPDADVLAWIAGERADLREPSIRAVAAHHRIGHARAKRLLAAAGPAAAGDEEDGGHVVVPMRERAAHV